ARGASAASWADTFRESHTERRGGSPPPLRPLSLSGQSYWLDVWLFVLFDLALLVFVYLLP
uniref:Uncharacterized protein n=1 Tax=Chrysemys picta bellii TaxID=8478 RepID=A0A8C3INK7_CHRPI